MTFPKKTPIEAALSLPSRRLFAYFLSPRLATHFSFSPFFVAALSPFQGMKKGARSEVRKVDPLKVEPMKMGPLKMALLNGLSVSRQPMHDEVKDEPEQASNDERVRHLIVGGFFYR